jgi:hypothetical protein
MTLTEFIDINKSAFQSLGSKAASPFGLLYQESHINFIQYKDKMIDSIHDMIESGTIDSNGMSAFQAVTILFDGINHKQPTLC